MTDQLVNVAPGTEEDGNSAQPSTVELAALLERIRILEKEKEESDFEMKELRELVVQLKAENEKMVDKLKRHEECIVFPMLKLPDEILLEVIEKLQLEQRIRLRWTCSAFRSLLRGRKSKNLESRLPANIGVQIRAIHENVELHVKVLRRRCPHVGRCCTWNIAGASRDLPPEVTHNIKRLADDFESEQVNIKLSEISDNDSFHQTIKCALRALSSYYPIVLDSVYVLPQQMVIDILLESEYSISISMFFLSRYVTLARPDDQRIRQALVWGLKDTAERLNIPFVHDLSGATDKFEVHLHVADDGGRSITIRG